MLSTNDPIIIVEDDTEDIEILKTACRDLNLINETLFFRNGLDALLYLRTTKHKPFIILCDINMPRMDGLQLRNEINKDEFLRKKSIPFVFFTTGLTYRSVDLAYEMSVQGFFLKDSTFEKLVETLS